AVTEVQAGFLTGGGDVLVSAGRDLIGHSSGDLPASRWLWADDAPASGEQAAWWMHSGTYMPSDLSFNGSQPVLAVFQGIGALGGKSFKARIAAVRALGAGGDERAAPVLEALMAGKLFTRKADKKIVIVEKKGRVYFLTDAVSGAKIGQAVKKALKKFRVNNRMRGVIRGVLGALTLLHKDPARRIAAANALSDVYAMAGMSVPVQEAVEGGSRVPRSAGRGRRSRG
ncbi:hypothetical protein, partial [uncultured Spongiibacter sp.]|uniref:hypothetical protein n=1 Tax=uncultured Spongiibacter sp. TaxID=870896 RepID=UPI00259734AD